MKLFYVRWPNEQHTLAFAKDRHDLWDLLDESGDPGACLLKELRGPGRRFAFDFMPVDGGEDEGFRGRVESMHQFTVGTGDPSPLEAQ